MKKYIYLQQGLKTLEDELNNLFNEASQVGGFSGLYDFGGGYVDPTQVSVSNAIRLAHKVISANQKLESANSWSIADGSRSGFDLILNGEKIAAVVDGKIIF